MATEPKRIKVVTEKGVAGYPKLNTPDTKFVPAGQFSIKLKLGSEAAQAIIAQHAKLEAEMFAFVKEDLEAKVADKPAKTADAESKEKWKKAKEKLEKLKMADDKPFKAVLDDDGEATGEYNFTWKLNATYTERKTSTTKKQRPLLVDSKGKELDPANVSVWSGSIVKVGGFLSPFYTAIGVGVSLKLKKVMIVKLVSGGDADIEMKPEEDGYEGATEEAQSTSPASGETSGAEPDDF